MWRAALPVLADHLDRTQGAPAPYDAELDGLPVGQMVKRARAAYTKGLAHPELCAQLEAVPFWTWRQPQPTQRDYLHAFQQFVREHGTAAVPADFVGYGVCLGAWVNDPDALGRLSRKARASFDAIVTGAQRRSTQ
jgi:hypothetical protein